MRHPHFCETYSVHFPNLPQPFIIDLSSCCTNRGSEPRNGAMTETNGTTEAVAPGAMEVI